MRFVLTDYQEVAAAFPGLATTYTKPDVRPRP